MGESVDTCRDFEIKDGVLVKYLGSSTNVKIPDGITVIGENAFAENHDIVEVDLNETEQVRANAFYFCFNLRKITAKNVKTVGENAFKASSQLETVIFGAVQKIEKYAFYSCWIKDISGLEQLEIIGNSAFESAEFTEFNCPNLKELGASAFRCCSELKAFTVPNGITTITAAAFSGCSALKNIVLHDGVEVIEHAAFWDCGLKRITIPKSVKRIDNEAFARCCILAVENLSELVLRKGSNKQGGIAMHAYSIGAENVWDIVDDFVFCNDENGVSYLIEYIGELPENKELVLPRTYKGGGYEIGQLAFEYSPVKSLDIGDGVTAIGKLAFYECKELTDVKFGKSIKRIDRLAFKSCEKLRTAELQEGVEELGCGAFLFNDIEYIVLGSSVKRICNSNFDYCRKFCKVYYLGTPEQLSRIKAGKWMAEFLSRITVYYSEDPPSDDLHKYWHYVDGKITEY